MDQRADLFDRLVPTDHFGPTTSAILALGVMPGVVAVASAVALLLWFRARVLARAVTDTSRDAIVSGVVEEDEEAESPVRITISQRGTEWINHNGYMHRWTEVNRKVAARPFYLRTSQGTSIRVEPDNDVFLVDGLEETRRQRVGRDIEAVLCAGEHAHVVGRFVQGFDPRGNEHRVGYRDAGASRVLRAPPRAPMLISTEPLADRYVRRARLHGRWAIALCVCGLVAQSGSIFYLARLVAGRVIEGVVTNQRTWLVRANNRNMSVYGVTACTDFGTPTERALPEATVRRSDFERINKGDRVPFVDIPGAPRLAQIGRRATLPGEAFFLWLIVACGAIISYMAHARVTRPWYARRRLVHEGKGTLERSPKLAAAAMSSRAETAPRRKHRRS